MKRATKRTSTKKTERAIPGWAPLAAVPLLVVMVMLTINYRAFSEYRRESLEHQELSDRIEDLTDENVAIQEETHYLKTDPKAIEKQAKRLGFEYPKKEKSSRPAK